MRSTTRMIAAAAAVTAALAAGGGAAMAAAGGARPSATATPMSASKRPGGARPAEQRQGHDAITAAVARELHISTARVSAALRPLFAAGHAGTSSPVLAAAAHSLGISAQQLDTALAHAKQSLAADK